MGKFLVIKGADFSMVAVENLIKKVTELDNCYIDAKGDKKSKTGYSVAVFNVDGISKVRVRVDEVGVGGISWIAAYREFTSDTPSGFIKNSTGISYPGWAKPYEEVFSIPSDAKFITVSLGAVGDKAPGGNVPTTTNVKNVYVSYV